MNNPVWRTVWGKWRGGRVGIQIEVLRQSGALFYTRPVGIVAGPGRTLFRFKEECDAGWLDLTLSSFSDPPESDIEELMQIAGFTAHEFLHIASLANKQVP